MLVSAETDAFIVVDMQNDFVLPTGALSVAGGPNIIAGINATSAAFPFRLQVASQDWHPANHVSFRAQCGPWPPHCVHGSQGAELHADLDTSRYNVVVRKGVQQGYDSYSAFTDDGGLETGLSGLLRGVGVTRVFVCGLAYDFCVLATVRDALKAGFEAVLLEDLSLPVSPETAERAREELVVSRAVLAHSSQLCVKTETI